MKFIGTLRQILRDDRGATAIEYSLIAALICIVCIAAMINVGNEVGQLFNTVETKVVKG